MGGETEHGRGANRRLYRSVKPLSRFRLARPRSAFYTYSLHALGCASVAQRQSTGFVNQWLWVQIPPLASLAGKAVAEARAKRPTDRTSTNSNLPFRPLSGGDFQRHGWADGRAANGIRL